MLCVTRRNSIVKRPTVTRSARAHARQPACATSVLALLELRLHHRQRQRGAVHRALEMRQHVRHGADVVLVAVGEHQRRDLGIAPAGAGPG